MNDDIYSEPAFWIFVLIVRVIFAVIAGFIANHKGRSVAAWTVLTFVFEIIPLIVVACLPNLKTAKAKEDRVERENRRLREQLRQEQIKSESFRQHASARLDVHDNHMGIDTRRTLPEGQAAPAQLESFAMNDESTALEPSDAPNQLAQADDYELAAPTPRRPQRQWHYESAGESHGPIDDSQLMSLIRSGAVGPETLLWTEGMTDWQPADEVDALRPHLLD